MPLPPHQGTSPEASGSFRHPITYHGGPRDGEVAYGPDEVLDEGCRIDERGGSYRPEHPIIIGRPVRFRWRAKP